MTIEDIREYRSNAVRILKQNDQHATANAVEVAFGALLCLDQYKWERDIVLGQLEELGIAFGEKIDGVYLTKTEFENLLHYNHTKEGEWVESYGIHTWWINEGECLSVCKVPGGEYKAILSTKWIDEHGVNIRANSVAEAKLSAVYWARNLLQKVIYETERAFNHMPSLEKTFKDYQEEQTHELIKEENQ